MVARTRPSLGLRAGRLAAIALLVATQACGSEDVLQPGPYDANGVDPASDGAIDVQPDVADDVAAPDCPAGYRVWPLDAPAKAQCVPDTSLQCSTCPSPALASPACLGGPCLAIGDGAPACVLPCLRLQDLGLPGTLDSCPKGSTCTPIDASTFGIAGGEPGAGTLNLCVPDSQDCSCDLSQQGATRPCKGAGLACVGVETCGAGGWSGCDAPAATDELCNGKDDDCDGQTDEGLPTSQPCTTEGDAGSCAGVSSCKGADGWVCDAPTPAAEACNGKDDDCDGQTDEDFVQDGVYGSGAHCGVCGNSCEGAIDHGSAACDTTALPPFCAVATCEPGYVKSGNGCVPKVVGACDSCDIHTDCGVVGACIATGIKGLPTKVCLLPCEPDAKGVPSSCAKGATCQTIEGSKRCVPQEATCTCTAANEGAERGCTRSTEAGTCGGVETCKPGQGWVGCSAKTPTAEVCNGEDDDCDGKLDDGAGGGVACPIANPYGVCQGVTVCNGKGGLSCVGPNPADDVCNGKDDDCDGATDELAFDPKLGVYATLAHCGGCNQSCALPAAPHTLAVCQVQTPSGGASAACGIGCTDGYLDANGDASDGCECKPGSAIDPPGGGDIDCDGVDGDVEDSVFVAKWGNDAWPGTVTQPVASVLVATSIALQTKRHHILIGAGSYAEAIQVAAGVSVWGGYGPGFVTRDIVKHETILAPGLPLGAAAVQATVACQGITGGAASGETRVDGLTIIGRKAVFPGSSSYAVVADGCDARFALSNNKVLAGEGAPGGDGAPGLNGLPGVPGQNGQKGGDIGHAICTAADQIPGGAGGLHTCVLGKVKTEVSGGPGGAAICPDYHEKLAPPQCSANGGPPLQTQEFAALGKTGKGNAPGQGGAAGSDAYSEPWNGKVTACNSKDHDCDGCVVPLKTREGGVGNSGGSGAAGKGGNGGGGEAVGSAGWVGQAGGPGSDGSHGSGGGGGGGGGGVEVVGCVKEIGYSDVGGTGAGGGSGGCAGTGGGGGSAGGGAFAIFIVAPAGGPPRLEANTLVGGKGGKGGDGGPGGFGGPGAPGGNGGPATPEEPLNDCSPEGGDGGDGGDGGSGGGGGGGRGGPSILIAAKGVTQDWLSKAEAANTVVTVGVAGKGGNGGAGAPGAGSNGADGDVVATKRWP